MGSGSGSDRSAGGLTDDRGSTSASPAHGGGSLAVEDPTRPKFKRLPSQTQGPEYAKWVATTNTFDLGDALGEWEVPLLQQRGLTGNHGLVMVERARRMSFPGGNTGIVGLQD